MRQLLLRFVSKLNVSRKLVLIYILDLSAVIFVSTILINEKYIAIDFARNEIKGNAYISEVRDAVFAYSRDPEGAKSRLLRAEEKFGQGLGSQQFSSQLVATVDATETVHDERDRQAFVSKHLNLARPTQALITRIGNQSNLILDPNLETYYTMSLIVMRFPELFELSDRVTVAAIAVTKSKNDIDRQKRYTEYLIAEGRLDSLYTSIVSDYAEAIAAGGRGLEDRLLWSRDRLLSAIEQLRKGARSLVENTMDNAGTSAVMALNRALDDSLLVAWKEATTALDTMLNDRISHLFTRMWLHLGAATALLMLILSVVYFVARTIVVPVRRLANVATKVKDTGDHGLRAVWTSDDELGRLVSAFNSMLGQLDEYRVTQQELTARASAMEAQRELLEGVPTPLMVTAIPEHKVLHANSPAKQWLSDSLSDPWLRGLDRARRAEFFQQLADQGQVDGFEARWHCDDREQWMLLSARRLVYEHEDALLTAFTPIDRIKSMESRLELWAKVFEASSESIMVTNADRAIVTINRAFSRSTGYEFSEVVGASPEFLRASAEQLPVFELAWSTATWRSHWQGELIIRKKSGESFPIWAVINAVRTASGEIVNYVATFLDISERKETERRISHLAHHDTLTDLPNRALCLDRLNMAIQQAKRSGKMVAVLFMDLDRFKAINDTLGHHVGDGLLQSVATRLLGVVRGGDTVSRLGGDEFVVVFSEIDSKTELQKIVAQRLVPTINAPHQVNEIELNVGCSVGIAVFPEDGSNVETLMRNADAAMYYAKHNRREREGRFEFYSVEMDRAARDRQRLENELQLAITNEELRLHYQPKVEAATGKLLGVEALIRWQHPSNGLISPSVFISVAEESGLIVPVGHWVVNEALRQHARWRSEGVGEIPVSINLSAAQIKDDSLVDMLRKALIRHNVAANQLELELTETLLMLERGRTVELMGDIKALGVNLSVDDFGTGYSSLNYLHRFPIDKLKIDQSFVSDMLVDPKDHAITLAIIGLGHTLGLRVVAEGVETVDQRTALTSAGCDELQGYYFSRPLPATQFAEWARTWGEVKRAKPVMVQAEEGGTREPESGDSAKSAAPTMPA